MIRLSKGGKLYMYSSADIRCIMSGDTIIGGRRKTVELFNYVITGAIARLVYQSIDVTEINNILVFNVESSSLIQLYLNSTDERSKIYEGKVGPDSSLILDEGVFIPNSFVDSEVDSGGPKTGFTKSISITSPTSAEDVTLFFTSEEIEIQEVFDVIRGSGADVNWNIKFGKQRDVADGSVFNSDRNTTSLSGASTMEFDNPIIPANSWVWFTTSFSDGIIDDLNITFRYT